MEIGKLHIGAADYDFFTSLDDKEKIEFLSDGYKESLRKSSIERRLSNSHDRQSKIESHLNDLFQDTLYEEMICDNNTLRIIILNNHIHINSDSLKLIRGFVYKLIDDGHLLIRNRTAKKVPGIDNMRYYRCYEIIGTGDPFCPN